MASVRERPTRNGQRTWAVLYRHGGKQASKTFDAPKAADEFKLLVDMFGPDKALRMLAGDADSTPKITVSELAERFLEWKADDVTPRTLADYRRDISNHVTPHLGHHAAELVDEADVQRWVDKLKKVLGPKTIADRHMLLHQMYDFGRAKSRRLVTHNPCLETDLPKKTKKPPKGATVPEFRAILASASERGHHDARDLVEFIGETGWRFSEATALLVDMVEDDGTDVWVNMTRVFRIIEHRQVLVDEAAKSWAGFRRIRLFPDSAATVRRRVIGKAPGDFVFTNRGGRHWNQNTFLRETWPSILKGAGLREGRKPTPHWLRHMHVAVLAASGTPMQEIQRRIGHESIQTTLDVYGGMVGDISDDTMSRAADLMAGRRTAPTVAPGGVVVGEVVSGKVAIRAGAEDS